jgi:hypothetical protein
MRDLLTLLENLNESTGLAGRKFGDVFKNPSGEEIIFNEIKFFPEGGGKYTPEELNQVLQQIEQNNNIVWQNNRSPRTGGFSIAKFSNPDGEIYYGRYLESIKPNVTDNYVPNSVGEYKLSSKSAAKEQEKVKPSDLLTEVENLTVANIMNQLAESLGTDSTLYAIAHKIAIGEPLPITFKKPTDVSFTAFTNYFCEILQPIALQKGQYTGNAAEAAEKFLGNNGYSKTLITFNFSKNAGLSDSKLTNKAGASVEISSKAGKGATASTKNLLNKIEQLQQTPDGANFLEKYKEEVDIIDNIRKAGQAGAPLYLATKYKIISEEEAEMVNDLKMQGPVNLDNLDELNLTPRLKKLAKSRTTNNPESVNLYYHLMAAIAFKAADEVNENTNFSKAAADILNNGALVQVYTKATEGKDSWTLKEFETVYPGESIKGVYLSADKTYYSTGINGNYTFAIDRGQGKPKAEPEEKQSKVSKTPTLAKAAQDITDIKSSTKVVDREVGNVGRSKRK